MSDLTEFLLARIAEDERAAERASSFSGAEAFQNDNYGHLTVQPDRVLRECEAKRRIVEIAADQIRLGREARGWDNWEDMALQTLRALASVYADHPDCREEWKP